MNRSKYRLRQPLVERIEVAVTPEMKEATYELAARMGKPAAEFIRDAISNAVTRETAAVI